MDPELIFSKHVKAQIKLTTLHIPRIRITEETISIPGRTTLGISGSSVMPRGG